MRKFYEDGLKFECTRCSICCRRDAGFVFLTENDVKALCVALGMKRDEFILTYCRRVKLSPGIELLSLKEKSNNDCFFWSENSGGCSVYGARPLQCRSYPFWKNFLENEETWKRGTADCPGAGRGKLYSKEYIDECIKREDAEKIIS